MTVSKEIIRAAEAIKNGELVAFPTETVYGLGADVFNVGAIKKVFEIKERPSFDPLIVHISKMNQLDLLCSHVSDKFVKLAQKFWPGPLSIVVPKSKSVPDLVTSGLDTVAIRMPAHHIALQLISESGTPIAAPSANKFGLLSPTNAAHVNTNLPGVNYILDGGRTPIGLESTVIALYEDSFKLLRPGAISVQDLEKVIPCNTHDTNEELLSPGLLKSHYSPRKPLFFTNNLSPDFNCSKAGLISFSGHDVLHNYKYTKILSKDKDLGEAAFNLFEALHFMENTDVEMIAVDPVPESGIGIAIMDRLRKAAYRYSDK